MSTLLSEKLVDFLEKASDWDEKPTTIPGVTVVKVAKSRKTNARMMVRLNLVDGGGRPLKKSQQARRHILRPNTRRHHTPRPPVQKLEQMIGVSSLAEKNFFERKPTPNPTLALSKAQPLASSATRQA